MSKKNKTGIQFKLRFEGNWVESEKVISIPTGSWRLRRPVTNMEHCCQCGRCYIFCPTGSVEEEGDRFVSALKHCKGCGICARVCPNCAITMEKEPGK